MKKLGICYPWDSPFVYQGFVESALNMRAPTGFKIKWFVGKGWCAARRHNDSIEKAVAWKADLICIVSADQVYPENMFELLTERIDGGCEVISARVPMRGHVKGQNSKPFQAMAWRSNGRGGFDSIKSTDGDLQEIDIIGSGVLMLSVNTLMRLKKPWFTEDIELLTFKRKGPCDSRFVWRLRREAKAKVFVDTTIKVKHLNIFAIDETYSERFSDWEEK